VLREKQISTVIDMANLLGSALGSALLFAHLFDLSTKDVAKLTIGDLESLLSSRLIDYQPSASDACFHYLNNTIDYAINKGRKNERVFLQNLPLEHARLSLDGMVAKAKARQIEKATYSAMEIKETPPHFIVLGAPRCATTWIYSTLKTHPSVALTKIKEPEYWGDSGNFYLGSNWYYSQFDTQDDGRRLRGDVSVGYLYSDRACDRIYDYYKDRFQIKLVVMLRNPIDRALSHYSIRLSRGTAPLTFEKALSMHYYKKLFIDYGKYYNFVEMYLTKFKRDQMHFIFYDDVKNDAVKAAKELASFLNIDEACFNERHKSKVAASTKVRFLRLHKLIYSLSYLSMRFSPNYGIGSSLRSVFRNIDRKVCFSTKAAIKDINAGTRRTLLKTFAESNEKLGTLLGRDLSNWNA